MDLLHPRLSSNNIVEIVEFNLPENVKLIRLKRNRLLLRKLASLTLRVSIKANKHRRDKILYLFVKHLLVIFLNISGLRTRNVVTSNNVGYSDLDVTSNSLLLGYFQSYKWSQDILVHNFMTEISLSPKTFLEYEDYVDASRLENPLVVHIRLGDYLLEDSFGIPSADYYNRNILNFLSQDPTRFIWLFSDNVEEAKKMIDYQFHSRIRTFSHFEDSTLKTFQIMRLGKDFIIGNSTFSWWAARLHYGEINRVVTPEPWFKSQAEPVDLIPSIWYRSSADFEDFKPIE